jgi:hypothetical protein
MNSSSATKVSTSLVFSEPTLFLMISPRPFEDRAAAVTGFAKKNGPAERKGVRIGWVLAAVDRIDTLQKTFAATLALYRSARRPVELKFVRDPDYSLVVGEPPTDLKFEPAIEECIVAPFHSEPGPAGGWRPVPFTAALTLLFVGRVRGLPARAAHSRHSKPGAAAEACWELGSRWATT